MIGLTRINHAPLVLNADMIEHVEITPGTVIAMMNGQKFMVAESAEEVIQKAIDFRRAIAKLPEVVEASDGAADAGLAQSANYGRTTENRERKTRARQAVRPQAGLRHHRWNSPGHFEESWAA